MRNFIKTAMKDLFSTQKELDRHNVNDRMLRAVQESLINATDFSRAPDTIDWDHPVFSPDTTPKSVSFTTQFGDETGVLSYEFDKNTKVTLISGDHVVTRDFANDITAHYGPRIEERIVELSLPRDFVSLVDSRVMKNHGWAYDAEDKVWTTTISTAQDAQRAARGIRENIVLSAGSQHSPIYVDAKIVEINGEPAERSVKFDTSAPLFALGYSASQLGFAPGDAPLFEM